MKSRIFGKTGLAVSPIGFGGSQIGHNQLPQKDCDRLLNGLLDAGLNLVDTAACYKDSEEKIGKAISHRRGDYVLVTKCGHQVDPDDPEAWTPEVVRKSAERSLRRLKTDAVDVLLFHGCPIEQARNEALIEALVRCREDGLARFIGFSADNQALRDAIALGVCDCVETTLNFLDQQVLESGLPEAAAANLGVIIKRPIANAVWRDPSEFTEMFRNYAKPYAERLKATGISPETVGFDGSWIEMALRFTLFQPGAQTAIVGSEKLDHLLANMEIAGQGPLPDEVVEAIRAAWKRSGGADWEVKG